MDGQRTGVIGISGGWSSERLANAVEKRTGETRLIDMDDVVFDVTAGRVFHKGADLTEFDALIVKKIGAEYSHDLLDRLEVLRFLHRRGVRVFSNPDSMMLAIDRLSGTVTLRLGDIPLPPTVVTENVAEAVSAVETFGRAVLKPLFSSKARGMVVVEPGDDVASRVSDFRKAGNPVIYIQQMLELPGRDLGLVFLGGEYIGTYARVAGGDSWNTTTHSGGRYAECEPPDDIVALADRAQKLFGLDFTSVDVAETPDGPIVFEVSAFGGFRGLLQAAGTDVAPMYVDYVLREIGASA